jgi:nitrogenase molybdenum-iron protein beta chain
VVHSTAGCGAQYYNGITPFGGRLPDCASCGVAPSSTNIGEKHVVFGGGSRLREQLKNTVKILAGDLYAIVTGCSTEMVGDDIAAMAKEGHEQGWPVVYASTPGFRGSVHRGYELAVRVLIEQLPKLPSRGGPEANATVNLLGIIPQQDVFWQGHLSQVTGLLADIGIVANPLLGIEQSVDSWHRIPNAALNVVLSPWGRDAAKLLEEKYGTAWIEIPGVPIGPKAVEILYNLIGALLGPKSEAIQALRSKKEAWFAKSLASIASQYFEKGFQREFAIVGEVGLISSTAEFLTKTLGLIPKLAVVTDPIPEDARGSVLESLRETLAPFAAPIVLSEDASEIGDLLRTSSPELILGSSLELPVARELQVPFLAISFPIAGRIVLNRGYAGYEGALTLVEDLGSAILSNQ